MHPYQGDYATLLRKTISDYLTDDNVLARFTTFVQSSGMGKSRMVDEMARKVIVLPVCLSEADCMYLLYSASSFLIELLSVSAARWFCSRVLQQIRN